MHPRVLACGTAALLASAGLVGCGGSDDDSSSTAVAAPAATVPDGKLGASAASPILGFYGGIDCGSSSAADCQEAFRAAREGYMTHCRTGTWPRGAPRTFTLVRKEREDVEFNYFCFTLKNPQSAVDFIYAGRTVVRSVYVSTDRFPRTEDSGWGVQGEWFSTTTVRGKVNNPNGVTADWRATLVAEQ
ncbi:unannotated protein [freshwater metagenome]|uniref:Unannotated protein n=1 Tax=freshwater metagenome TaxID=449393 RepID=A0A6J7GQC5_9ZZZZ|nr:hypothetical protein [Actinomycetota bacterium]